MAGRRPQVEREIRPEPSDPQAPKAIELSIRSQYPDIAWRQDGRSLVRKPFLKRSWPFSRGIDLTSRRGASAGRLANIAVVDPSRTHWERGNV